MLLWVLSCSEGDGRGSPRSADGAETLSRRTISAVGAAMLRGRGFGVKDSWRGASFYEA